MEEFGVPGENHRHVASLWQALSHNDTNNYLATVQDKNEVVILIIMLVISVLLNIILLVKHCKDKEKRKIQGEYSWFWCILYYYTLV
jgi:hypothetical protein